MISKLGGGGGAIIDPPRSPAMEGIPGRLPGIGICPAAVMPLTVGGKKLVVGSGKGVGIPRKLGNSGRPVLEIRPGCNPGKPPGRPGKELGIGPPPPFINFSMSGWKDGIFGDSVRVFFLSLFDFFSSLGDLSFFSSFFLDLLFFFSLLASSRDKLSNGSLERISELS